MFRKDDWYIDGMLHPIVEFVPGLIKQVWRTVYHSDALQPIDENH